MLFFLTVLIQVHPFLIMAPTFFCRELNSAATMGSIITWYRIPLTPAHVLRTIAPTTGLSLESRHRVGPLDSAERLTGLGSYSVWPGFHIWDVFMEVNENPGRKVQLFRTDLFASDLVGTAKRERNSNNY